MKKIFLLFLPACGFFIFVISCSNKISPMAPSSRSSVVKANDVAPTPTYTPGPQSVTISGANDPSAHPAEYAQSFCQNICVSAGAEGGITNFPYFPLSYPSAQCPPAYVNYLLSCAGAMEAQYSQGTDTFSRSFTIPPDAANLSLSWSVQSSGAITISINGVQVQNGCSGSYDFNNPPTTGCLAGVKLNLGGNNFSVSAYYGPTTPAGTIYSLVYNYVGSFLTPTPTFTPTVPPTLTPTGTLTPPTMTPTGTLTVSVTPTITGTVKTSPTVSGTVSQTPTTPTGTITPSVSSTVSATQSITPSQTITGTPTGTPTITGTPSETTTNTETESPSPSATFTPSPTPTCPGADYSPAYTPYKQYTGGWQSDKMPTDNTNVGPNLIKGQPDPHTIQADGCLLTNFAMIAPGYDPSVADVTLSANGDITDTGDLPDLRAVANHLGLGDVASYTANNSQIPQALGESDFVFARVPHGGRTHYVLITGTAYNQTTNNCDYTISDPGSASATFLSQYGSVNLLIEVNNP